MPCCRVKVRRAKARPRRVSDAKRARNVALSRSMYAVLITPPPCERRLRVSTRAGAPTLGGVGLWRSASAVAESADEAAVAQAVEALRKAILSQEKPQLEALT